MSDQIFDDEAALQQWIEDTLENDGGLSECIINAESIEEMELTGLSNNEAKVLQSYRYCLKSLINTEIIGSNENISLNPKDSLKPDLLLYCAEMQSLVIVEIKNLIGPSRQAGTELGAYGAEIKAYLPMISDGDIINVIVSAHWPTLLRHYAYNEIFWLQRNLVCLQPVVVEDEICLQIVLPADLIAEEGPTSICERHMGRYRLCLYDMEQYGLLSDPLRHAKYEEQMKTALTAMAFKGNAQKTHGFAFLWKEKSPFLSPYNYTILNVSPFQALERFSHDEGFIPNITMKKLVDILLEDDPNGHGGSLESIVEHASVFLNSFASVQAEGFMNWEYLKEDMLADSNLIAFAGWGVFGELFLAKLTKAYKEGKLDTSGTDPQLGLEMVNEVVDSDYPFIDLARQQEDEDADQAFFQPFFNDNDESDDELFKYLPI